jgi:transcriptional regulator of acetoin/glycerol metabolism
VLGTLEEYRDAATHRYLKELLGADLAEALRLSGLSRSGFYALLKQYGLSRQ